MSIEVAGLTPDPLYDPAYRARKQILLELELKVWNDYVKTTSRSESRSLKFSGA